MAASAGVRERQSIASMRQLEEREKRDRALSILRSPLTLVPVFLPISFSPLTLVPVSLLLHLSPSHAQQGNIYKLPTHTWLVFDVWLIDEHRHATPAERLKMLADLGLQKLSAPVLLSLSLSVSLSSRLAVSHLCHCSLSSCLFVSPLTLSPPLFPSHLLCLAHSCSSLSLFEPRLTPSLSLSTALRTLSFATSLYLSRPLF